MRKALCKFSVCRAQGDELPVMRLFLRAQTKTDPAPERLRIDPCLRAACDFSKSVSAFPVAHRKRSEVCFVRSAPSASNEPAPRHTFRCAASFSRRSASLSLRLAALNEE